MSAIANTALNALLIAQAAIQNSAHNIANSKTDGFKRLEVQASDLFYHNLKRAGSFENADLSRRPVGAQVGTGAKIDGIYRILEQGNIKQTNNPLDIALTGMGYFAIALPNDKRGYTRNGALHIDAESRRIVTLRGEPLDPEITIDEGINLNDVVISASGIVSVKGRANPGEQEAVLGQITIYTFANERGLELAGNNMLLETEASGAATEVADQNNLFRQFALEESNVSVVDELTKMISNQRLYELAMNYIKAESDMEKKLTEIS